MSLKEELYKALSKIYENAEESFSGLGVLVYSDINKLPISPLYGNRLVLPKYDLYEDLTELSNYENIHHDGFHLISEKLKVTHISQYFYPAPIAGVTLDPNMGYGARYFVAKIGSALPGVIFSAVVGKKYGVQLFENGDEIEVALSD